MAEALALPSNPETEPFWQACREGRFLVRRCDSCGQAHWYPRTLCPFCFSDRTVWQDGSGRGTIYSFSIMRRVPEPYAIAYVTLDEGPSMMTTIVDCDFDTIRIGMPVTVAFKTLDDGRALPVFRPA
ncbi:MAG: Zn-ribbon domain-containing OB-fold protein [Ferrovibrio sp.]|uniref:Zn-ribbon domain-containing OB-fold protein n=1 Tax=Ferrovibrio sp. TaxID=1917215 RepID=UPI0026261152|nr:Zn-ribbon domain-containing OB-fold protein [Ferrovibrio sp.]MCW0234132.1 Zn-ribbon domain-containing OB-fold protein [Ferrovibrio sp.]